MTLNISYIDDFLNKITMYKLVLYYLIGLILIALGFSALHVLSFPPIDLLFEAVALTAFCWIFNEISAKIFKVPTNTESYWITALILTLIISPSTPGNFAYIGFLFWAALLAMASKYILAINRKHIFNPAALAVAVTAFALGRSATWWVGTGAMAVFVLIGGLLLVRKIKRFDLIIAFFISALFMTITYNMQAGLGFITALQRVVLYSSLLFFAFVMLTEPLTTPPTKGLRITYGLLTGFLFAPQVHFFSIYSTPELALLAANVFSWLASPKKKLLLSLKEKEQLTPTVYNFAFASDTPFKFSPGQYLEWTIGHNRTDSRGNRRYFTIASSPTEKEMSVGIKFYEPASSFKKALLAMQPGDTLLAGQLAGDFVLPRNKKQKLVFIAGGIGITPFRSMLKNLLDKNEKRDIFVFYSSRNPEEFAYVEILEAASRQLGINTVFTVTDNVQPEEEWLGEHGQLSPEMIRKYVPDYFERTFYISGPRGMVVSFEEALAEAGINKANIKTDFFPGFV